MPFGLGAAVGTIVGVTELHLSPARRDELAALLGDDRRLRTTFPAVADYLETAPGLPGTGDDRADRAFDLRMLHYLTGGASDNPYWEIVAPAVTGGPAERHGRREVNGGRARGSARLGYTQTVLQAAYAYAIPAPATLDWIAGISGGRCIVEIGAGRGYWAHQLALLGLQVLAFDAEPPDIQQNLSFPEMPGQPCTWHPVGDPAGLARLRARPDYGDCLLLLCWPPGWGDPMASQALADYQRAGGDRLVYIGEPRGGKTADEAFFAALAAEWRLVAVDPEFVAWWNLADSAQCWVRR